MNDLIKVFKVMSFFDQMRWNSYTNNNLINYSSEDLNADAKILTHWLCYITDRQMKFQRIWDVGGFVFSDLVKTIKNEKIINYLDPNANKSFIRKVGEKYKFVSIKKVDQNIILHNYGFSPNENAIFSSRYYPSDYFSILYTMIVLSKYDFSISKYINNTISTFLNETDIVRYILFSLYLLSYFGIGQPDKSKIRNFNVNLNNAYKRADDVLNILNDKNLFKQELKNFLKKETYHQKRAWCALRDYFKANEFSILFIDALNNKKFNNIKVLKDPSNLQYFELPGDVWNNNSKFRKCILYSTKYNNSKNTLNKILREYYNENTDILKKEYPEQFDITFDFVPRMCDSNNCEICPIEIIKKNKKNKFYMVCNRDTNKYCSVGLVACNYKIKCIGDDCKLLEILGT